MSLVAESLHVFTLFCTKVFNDVPAKSSYHRVCYYTNWSQYRSGQAHFEPENVDPSLCTHCIYAFAKLVNNKLAPHEWNDDSTEWSKGM